jgi:hypothetical protein
LGSAIPANVGVNPSLTITALAERAMEHFSVIVPKLVKEVSTNSLDGKAGG